DSGMATHLGYKAGWQAPHYSNTAFGTEALSAPSDEMGNTAFGFWAAKDTRSGNNNTAMGQYSLSKNISGSRNTAQGSASLFNNVSGSRNTAIGHWALYISDTANDNTAIGSQALWINKASNNTAVGGQAMVNNTTGSMNTAVGWSAGSIINTGNGNTFLGYEANANVGTRINATAIGARAYADCNNCLILGSVSGVNNASSSVRVGIGTNNPSALLTLNSKIGSSNINFEVDDTVRGSLYATNGSFMDMVLATAFDNQTGRIRLNAGGTQFKISPLGTVTIGPSGMVGPYTLLVSDSDKDPMIQFQKGATDKGFVQIVNDDIKIGTNNSNDLGSFLIRTNGADRVKVDPSGNVGVGTSSPTVKFQVGANGDGTVARANSWTTFSDERYKTQIVSIDHALDKLDQIGGYYYQWKEGQDQSRQAGLIAQEVEKVLPEIVQTDEAGYKSVDYGKMNALLIQAIKEQQKEIEELKAILKSKKRK
ncbi:MAG TPA: tail fiber domain-containing protein, partial [Phnomibacter sp.]|nr:tail fiber domain-containing protein [Phnomibacter sp.]